MKSASYVAYDCLYKSLSARRVWIEIGTGQAQRSVIASLSARRVWIEIYQVDRVIANMGVTLREEGVD